MKFLIVLACALAAASASYLHGQHAFYTGQVAAPVYGGAQHLPIIGSNGVPLDTPAVQTAKAAHWAAKAEAHARNGDFVHGVVAPVVANVATPVVSTYANSVVAPLVASVAPAYNGPQHVPVIGANRVPIYTPAVQSAKATHFAAKAEAHARNGDFVQGVVAPAIANVAAPAVSAYSNSVVAPIVAQHTPAYTGPQHVPVIGANGVPVDTDAVQSAKAAHNVHKAEAHARNGDYVHQVVTPVVSTGESTYSGAVIAQADAPVYQGPQHHPVIGANGVPVDTPAVQTAKTAHLVAKAEAHARNGDFVQGVVAPVVSTYATKTVAPVVSTYASAPVVSSYTTKTFTPAVSAYTTKTFTPAISAYTTKTFTPAVSAYTTKTFTPAVSTYTTGPFVSTYATKTITPFVGQISAAYPTNVDKWSTYPVNGVPLETPEVVAAKANHFAAHAQALSRGRRGIYSPVAYSAHTYGAFPYATPVVRYY